MRHSIHLYSNLEDKDLEQFRIVSSVKIIKYSASTLRTN